MTSLSVRKPSNQIHTLPPVLSTATLTELSSFYPYGHRPFPSGDFDPDTTVNMASSSADSGEQPSAAQKLFLDHHATVEDVPDEDQAGGPSGGDGGPSWGPTMSVKAAGKQKAQAPAAALDTQSQELFPSLGGPKKTSAGTVPTWGAKNGTNGKANGASPANGPSRSSTPGSGVGTPSLAGRHGAPAVSLPGRNVSAAKHFVRLLFRNVILPRTPTRRKTN